MILSDEQFKRQKRRLARHLEPDEQLIWVNKPLGDTPVFRFYSRYTLGLVGLIVVLVILIIIQDPNEPVGLREASATTNRIVYGGLAIFFASILGYAWWVHYTTPRPSELPVYALTDRSLLSVYKREAQTVDKSQIIKVVPHEEGAGLVLRFWVEGDVFSKLHFKRLGGDTLPVGELIAKTYDVPLDDVTSARSESTTPYMFRR